MDVLSVTTAQGRIGHCRAKSSGTLLECLAILGLSRKSAESLLSLGAVYHEHERVTADRVLLPGQYVRVHLQPKRFPVDAVDWASTVVHCNDDFVVVNKPAGIPVHATVDNRLENVLHQLSLELGSPLYITQRLDSEVSGLLVLAKTREFQRNFNQLLVERKVKKKYMALVTCAPATGEHVHYMKPEKRSPKTVQLEREPGWLECVLSIEGVTRAGNGIGVSDRFEVGIDLKTGRTHQIRAQLSALGSPIVGDTLYGSSTPNEVNGTLHPGIALFSASTLWSDGFDRSWFFSLDPVWADE